MTTPTVGRLAIVLDEFDHVGEDDAIRDEEAEIIVTLANAIVLHLAVGGHDFN